MELKTYQDKLDKVNFENKTFKIVTIVLALTVLLETILVSYKISNEKIIILPPTEQLKEFWVKGNSVSSSYLEMMSDIIIYNMINITAGKKPNISFLLAMVPNEYFNQIKASLDKQFKYVQNNGITQTFYTTEYDVKNKGLILVHGILKQVIGDRVVNSSLYTIKINYDLKYGRFWIIGLGLQQEGSNNNDDE